MPPDEIGFHHREEFVVIEQFIELDQLRLELKLELGDHLEEVHGLVSIDYHDSCSGPVGHLGIGILQDRPISHRKLVLGTSVDISSGGYHRSSSFTARLVKK